MALSDKPARKSNLPEWAKANAQTKEAAPKPEWSMVVDQRLALAGAGVAVLLLAVVFGLGYQVAKKATTRELAAKHKAELADIIKNMAQTQGSGGQAVALPQPVISPVVGGMPAVRPIVPVAPVAPPADPRTPGLNYLRLCQVPEAEGEKLVGFLATKGQRTWRVPVEKAPHLVTIYAVNKGFAGGQRVEMEQFRAELRSLGDKWVKLNKGGNPFRSMMLEKYVK